MRRVIAVAVLALTVAGAAQAKPALRDVAKIDDGLFVVGLANEIRKACPAIKARYFKALSALRALEQTARDLGYTEDEVTRHIRSDAEKQRLRARAASYMAERGLEQTENGYCALGQAEIAQGSEIGALLRAGW